MQQPWMPARPRSTSASGRPGRPPGRPAVKTTSSLHSTSYVFSWSLHSRCTPSRLRALLAATTSSRSRTTSRFRRSEIPAQRSSRRLRRGCVALDQGADHVHTTVASPIREGAAQSGGLHLLGRALVVAARRGAVHHATAGELRSTDRTLAGPAGALLLVWLATATADLAAALRVVGARTSGRQLRDDDLVDQRDVHLNVEHLGGQLHRPVDWPSGLSTSMLLIVMPPSWRCGPAPGHPWGRAPRP